jgi:very-short-patch-repair endonuclease
LCGYGKRGRYIDKKVTQKLERQGYVVLRFWEHDINKKFKLVCDVLLDTIKKEKEKT